MQKQSQERLKIAEDDKEEMLRKMEEKHRLNIEQIESDHAQVIHDDDISVYVSALKRPTQLNGVFCIYKCLMFPEFKELLNHTVACVFIAMYVLHTMYTEIARNMVHTRY